MQSHDLLRIRANDEISGGVRNSSRKAIMFHFENLGYFIKENRLLREEWRFIIFNSSKECVSRTKYPNIMYRFILQALRYVWVAGRLAKLAYQPPNHA